MTSTFQAATQQQLPRTSDAKELSVRVLTEPGEIEGLRPEWEKQQWHDNADIDYFLLVNRLYQTQPWVIAVSQGDQTIAIAAGRIGSTRLKCSIGYKTVFAPKVREISIISGGLMGALSDVVLRLIIDCLCSALKKGKADVVSLAEVKTDSLLWNLALRSPFLLCRDTVAQPQAHHALTLPAAADGLFIHLKSKHRSNLKRLYKVLERDFASGINIRRFRTTEEVNQFCIDAEKVAAKSYLRALGVGFTDTESAREHISIYARRGAFQGYVLYVNEKPCAFWFGNAYGPVFYVGMTGFDPSYAKYEVGTVLLIKMLEDLVENSDGISKFDFGLGDARYKSIFSTHVWQEATIHIFAPSMKGIGINLVRTPLLAGRNGVQALLKRLNLENKIKRMWRSQRSQNNGN